MSKQLDVKYIVDTIQRCVPQAIRYTYANIMKDAHFVYETELKALAPYKGAMGMQSGDKIYINLSHATIARQFNKRKHLHSNHEIIQDILDYYVCIAAHEYGHYLDHISAIYKPLAIGACLYEEVFKESSLVLRMQLRFERAAYRLGMNVVPTSLRDMYITLNEKNLDNYKKRLGAC